MQPEARPLPELRPELRLLRGAASVDGAPSWLIHDPVQNRFIQIDAAAYRVLSRWRAEATAEALAEEAGADGRVRVDRHVVEELVQFLHQHKLTTGPPREGWRFFEAERRRARHSLWGWLVHNYLFFRVPLVRPQRFLEATLPLADLLASRWVTGLIATLGALGLYLTARQWDVFVATLPDLFTFEGVVLMALTLMFVKAAHELGHAYTAVRYGCRVPTMGLALMMMAPLLYTDVTDAWRLTDRRKRFRIDSAGIRVELSIAAIAFFLWSFLPDGALRGLAFNVSTLTLVSSLVVNLNPLMRFDGYYILSDVLGVENLQPRSFALGCWQLRETLFAIGAPCPEDMPRRRIRLLILCAWATWIYRLILFVGIALIVYHYFFKVLGVLLFLVEIGVFVARPVWGELKVWWTMKDRILRSRRAAVTLAVATTLLLLVIVPWSTRVAIPAVVEMAALQPLYATRGAIVSGVHVAPGAEVAKGDVIVTLVSPDLEHELHLARTSLKLAELKYARRGADATDREASLVLENQIRSLTTRIRGLEGQKAELVLKAPFAGRVVELNAELHPGRWIGRTDMVALIGEERVQMVKGYVSEADLWRIGTGAKGRFIPDAVARDRLAVAVAEIALGSSGAIEMPEVTSQHSGPIAVRPDEKGRLVPTAAQYLVKMTAQRNGPLPELSVRGVAVIDGEAESLLSRTWRQALKVLMRESGA